MKLTVVVLFCSCCLVAGKAQMLPADSWQKVKMQKHGMVTLFWYESQPFIFKTSTGMSGIEYEIFEDFKIFLKNKYGVTLRAEWKEGKSFGDTYRTIKTANQPGIFGVSAFSVTPERQLDVQFSKSYMSDISVLITSKNIPIVKTRDEFNQVFAKLTAITIEATTYEQDILKLKREGSSDFKIEYIPSSENILRAVEQRDSAFGFIDLPVYMKIFSDEPAVNVKRQNLFPVKRQGYAFITPLHSDWAEPLQEYFDSPDFKPRLERIIGNYIDIELYRFIESLAIQSNDMIVLLTKEKEIQYNDLLDKTEQIEKDARARNILVVLVGITLISLLVIMMLYRKRNQQNHKIELQRQSIELKNEQLERRNHHLVTLDEEKNNLIKILAHDMRTPINHVQGLAQIFLLSNSHLQPDDRAVIERISDAAIRLNKMITNILDIDSIENDRVKILMDNVALAPLLTQVLKSFERHAARKDITVSFLQKTNPEIRGDALFLIQIFENLVSNALKFSPKGTEICVRMEEQGESVLIAIKDQGPGLNEEDKHLLFKRFQRLSAKPTDGENSTGLGLSIVKKYVELMNGVVWCESEEGRGAEFLIKFRMAEQKSNAGMIF